jgi:hypothetical protein
LHASLVHLAATVYSNLRALLSTTSCYRVRLKRPGFLGPRLAADLTLPMENLIMTYGNEQTLQWRQHLILAKQFSAHQVNTGMLICSDDFVKLVTWFAC